MTLASLEIDRPITRIRPTSGWASIRVGELWEFRELLYFLAWRDIKIRYKQTVLGLAWVWIQPLFTMAIFTIFLGRLAGVPSDGVPYPIFSYAALVPWLFFATTITQSAASLTANANLLRKVYFPRVFIPLAAMLSSLVDFAVAYVLVFAMMAYYGIGLGTHALALPFFLGLLIICASGVAMWVSALSARFRDVRLITPFVVQAWMFATPVVYPGSLVPEQWRTLYALNPMATIVEGFRYATLGVGSFSAGPVVVSVAVCVAILVTGIAMFRRLERNVTDAL